MCNAKDHWTRLSSGEGPTSGGSTYRQGLKRYDKGGSQGEKQDDDWNEPFGQFHWYGFVSRSVQDRWLHSPYLERSKVLYLTNKIEIFSLQARKFLNRGQKRQKCRKSRSSSKFTFTLSSVDFTSFWRVFFNKNSNFEVRLEPTRSWWCHSCPPPIFLNLGTGNHPGQCRRRGEIHLSTSGTCSWFGQFCLFGQNSCQEQMQTWIWRDKFPISPSDLQSSFRILA